MLEKYAVGESVTSSCSKCKLNLDHVIVAMEGSSISKVRCKSCGSTHKFRDPADAHKTRSSRKKAAVVQTAEMLWEACIAEARGNECMYDMTGKYRVGDIVIHATFGKGVVRKVYYNKCDVLFKDRERLMASAN